MKDRTLKILLVLNLIVSDRYFRAYGAAAAFCGRANILRNEGQS